MDDERLIREIEKIEKLTGETDDELIRILLEDAESFVLGYTNRTVMIEPLYRPAREMAVIALNRMGTEGESKRSGAGESYEFEDIPKKVSNVLNLYRHARIGGKAHEVKTQPDPNVSA